MRPVIDFEAHRQSSHVCTACGSRFAGKQALEHHWDESPACKGSLNRPAGQFGARTPGQHCGGCHGADDAPLNRDGSCPAHAWRGCPGC